jgi:CelD/BcsL family acetyltransferase involved in cellulose biosynthesis
MRSDVLPLSALTPRDFESWRELAAAAISPNPFAEQDYVLPATRAWQLDDIGLLVVHDGDDWLAALPVRSVRRWRSVPGRCLAGWRHDYCYLGTPLVTGDDPEGVLATLITGGLRVGGCLALDWIDADGPVGEALSSALRATSRVVVVDTFERAALNRREADDYIEHNLSSRHRREYRRKRKQLESEVGELTLREDRDDPTAYTRFLEMERSGWKGETGTAMACRPGHGEFFIEVCERFARSGRLMLQSLTNEQLTVAMRSELIGGDIGFTFKIAFDEQFARFSPGVQLELANMAQFHASGLAQTDSCTAPENATLNRLWSDRRRLRSVVATGRGASGASAYARWRAAAALLPLRRKLRKPETGVRGH